jgi:hypothetical protein
MENTQSAKASFHDLQTFGELSGEFEVILPANKFLYIFLHFRRITSTWSLDW